MNRKANGLVIVLLVGAVVLAIGWYLVSQIMKPAPTATITPTPALNIADIDRSGAADEGDIQLIRPHLNCEKSQPCWNTTIGKTKDGDNPLYVFDLDLNKDGTITQADIDLVR